MRSLVSAASLAAALAVTAPAAQAQMISGQQLYMMLDGVISYVYYNCQMGNPAACANVQPIQAEAEYLLQAGQYCAQTGDQNACGYFQGGVAQVQMAYNQIAAQMQPAPAYDPYNPLGATHEDRMMAIQQFGAMNTQIFSQRMQQMDQNHERFLDFIRN